MRPWTFPLALLAESESSRQPLFQRIAQTIRNDIRRGRLRPGGTLPGSRVLAETLGVHRNTVLAAYRELESEGWIHAHQRTTRVSSDLPEPLSNRRASASGEPGFDLTAAPPVAPFSVRRAGPSAHRPFGGGQPDLRQVPIDLLARAYREALQDTTLLGYCDAGGEPRLRAALAQMLSEARGLAVGADQVLPTTGSQGALNLAARSLIRPGDRVAVEDPGYPNAWGTLRAAGATLVPVATDEAGLRIDALEQVLREGPLRAIYLTPHHQYPTTVTMSAARRLHLLSLAHRHRIAILEDDYDNEFHYEGRPVLPLLGEDSGGVVIYLGTLSKILAPGLRVGFVAGPRRLIQHLGDRLSVEEGQGDHLVQRTAAILLEEGLLQRHARKMRRLYLTRREAMIEALRKHLGGVVTFSLPAGGMSLWLQVDPAVDVEAWARQAMAGGDSIQTGRRFDFHGQTRPNLRLAFAALTEAELAAAVRRLARALPSKR